MIRHLILSIWDLRRNQQMILYVVATAIGVVVAFGAIGFRLLIEGVQLIALGFGGESVFSSAAEQPWWRVLLAPVAGGVAVSLMLRYIMRDGRPRGIPDVIAANAVGNARMPLFQGIAGTVLSATSIGAGASTGREGPIVQLGGTLAAWIAEKLGLSPAQSRTLLACGVATAVAASFNAPIAGVFFALEVVLGHYALHAFAPIVMASVAGTIVSRAYMGNFPAFTIPAYSFSSAWDVPLVLILGILSALVSILFVRACFKAEDLFKRITLWPRWAHPVIGGLIVGAVAIVFPEILGVGYEATDAALQGNFALWLLIVLLLLKIAMTAISLGAGFGGGVFSPAIFIGAMTGGTLGLIASQLTNGVTADHGLFAIIGMGAVAGAVLGAPISTFLIVFELVGDYQLSIAIMVTTAIASTIYRQVAGPSFFQGQLERRGLDLRDGRAGHILKSMRVRDVMRTDHRTVKDDQSIEDVRLLMSLSPHASLFVCDSANEFQGVITPIGLQQHLEKADDNEPALASAMATIPGQLIYQSDPLQVALSLMEATGEDLAPVLEDQEHPTIIGLIRYRDALGAYNRALLEERDEEHGER